MLIDMFTVAVVAGVFFLFVCFKWPPYGNGGHFDLYCEMQFLTSNNCKASPTFTLAHSHISKQ